MDQDCSAAITSTASDHTPQPPHYVVEEVHWISRVGGSGHCLELLCWGCYLSVYIVQVLLQAVLDQVTVFKSSPCTSLAITCPIIFWSQYFVLNITPLAWVRVQWSDPVPVQFSLTLCTTRKLNFIQRLFTICCRIESWRITRKILRLAFKSPWFAHWIPICFYFEKMWVFKSHLSEAFTLKLALVQNDSWMVDVKHENMLWNCQHWQVPLLENCGWNHKWIKQILICKKMNRLHTLEEWELALSCFAGWFLARGLY